MAKESGLGITSVKLDDGVPAQQTITNDVTNFSLAMPRAALDVTGVDKSAMERLNGLADFSATLNGAFNDAANMSHAVLKSVSTADVVRTLEVVISGQTCAAEVLVTDYALTRGNDGALTWSAPMVLADGDATFWA